MEKTANESFVIVTDSSCNLPADLADQWGLAVQPLSVLVDGTEYKNYLDEREIRFADMYQKLRDGVACSTSAANTEDFEQLLRPILESGQDILYIGFSTGLSNTYNAARIAVSQLREEFPARTILTVDSLCASLGQGLLVYHAVQRRLAGATLNETAAFVEDTRLHLCHWFTVDDLHHLRRGGRISSTVAIVGSMLQIKPVMHMDNAGKLISMYKVRGRRRSLISLVDEMEKRAINPSEQTVFISHGDCLEDAEYVADLVRERFGVKQIVINHVGPVIGAHSGPGTVALFFLGTER